MGLQGFADYKAKQKSTRVKAVDIEAHTTKFLEAVIKTYAQKNEKFTRRKLAETPIMFRNYCANAGIKGVQKAKLWNSIKKELDIAKAKSADPDSEL